VVKVLGADPVEQLMQGEVEADIAVTNSVVTAIFWADETECTSIVLVYHEDEREKIGAFAPCFSARILTVPFVGSTAIGENQFVPFLAKIIAKEKEKHRVHV